MHRRELRTARTSVKAHPDKCVFLKLSNSVFLSRLEEAYEMMRYIPHLARGSFIGNYVHSLVNLHRIRVDNFGSWTQYVVWRAGIESEG